MTELFGRYFPDCFMKNINDNVVGFTHLVLDFAHRFEQSPPDSVAANSRLNYFSTNHHGQSVILPPRVGQIPQCEQWATDDLATTIDVTQTVIAMKAVCS